MARDPLNIRLGEGGPDFLGDPYRRVLRARNGVDLFNAYPIRYYERGTRRVARPRAGPAIPWSPIATPRLPVKPARSS